jgi:hypothetical protein
MGIRKRAILPEGVQYCQKAGNQQFPQASLIAILQERQNEISLA